MNSRTTMLRNMDVCRKSKSVAVFAVALFTWTSGLTATAVHPGSHQIESPAEHPMVRISKHHFDQTGRLLGIGWGDGYHGCYGSGFRPGADRPPRSSHATRGRGVGYGNTYYDRFDRQDLIHRHDLHSFAPRAANRSMSIPCGQNASCNSAWSTSKVFSIDEIVYSSASSESAPSILEPTVINFESPVLDRPDIDPKALAEATRPTTEVDNRLSAVKQKISKAEPTLPSAQDSASQNSAAKPSSKPSANARD